MTNEDEFREEERCVAMTERRTIIEISESY